MIDQLLLMYSVQLLATLNDSLIEAFPEQSAGCSIVVL